MNAKNGEATSEVMGKVGSTAPKPELARTEPAPPSRPFEPVLSDDVRQALKQYERAQREADMSGGAAKAVMQGRAVGWALYIAEQLSDEVESADFERRAEAERQASGIEWVEVGSGG